MAEATERHGGALLASLASRADAVDAAVRMTYPDLSERGQTISNHAGWAAGRAAVELAKLHLGEER